MARKAIEVRRTAPQHIHWKLLRTYKALYRSQKGDEITIRSVTKPTRTKVLRGATGRRKYRLVKLQSSLREVIIVAKTKNRKKATVDQEEIEELEALEELEDEDIEDEEDEDIEDAVEEDDEDEDEPDDEDEDEDEEEDEPPKRSKSKAKGKTKTAKSREAANGRVGTQEVAAHFGIDGRALRILLRRHKVAPNEETGRYSWKSLESPQVVKIGKLIKSGEHKRAQKEQLDNLKSSKGKKTAKKGTTKTAKSGKSSKRKRAAAEEDDD